jgi:hypothetical protein
MLEEDPHMAEEKAAQKGGVGGWVKACLTTIFGLVSGACLMYFTGLLNGVIKPGKPLANFQSEPNGLQVVFHNRSSGGSDGWWDFGDGSALEPFVSSQQMVTHAYSHPGVYPVKLSLRNLFGDEHERSVNLTLGDAAVNAPPAIEVFEVVPIRPDNYAPATFKIVSKVKNADLAVWIPSHEQPVEVLTDLSTSQERYVTLKQPGHHLLKLAAYGGKQVIEKSQIVHVDAQPAGTLMLMAVLNITHQAVHITPDSRPHMFRVEFPPGWKEPVFKFTHERPARHGFQITDARLVQSALPSHVRSAKVEVTPDRLKVRLTGELVRMANAPTCWATAVTITQQQRSAMMPVPLGSIAAPLSVPGTTVLPMPSLQAGWVSTQRSLTLKVQDAQEKACWQCSQMPRTDELTVNGRRYRLTATEAGEKLRIDVSEVRPGGPPLGN